MDYFTDVLAVFLSLGRGNIVAVYGGSETLDLCSKDERRSYRVWNNMKASN